MLYLLFPYHLKQRWIIFLINKRHLIIFKYSATDGSCFENALGLVYRDKGCDRMGVCIFVSISALFASGDFSIVKKAGGSVENNLKRKGCIASVPLSHIEPVCLYWK